MSGIGVIFSRSGQQIHRPEIEKVAAALKKYGPEYQRVEISGTVGVAYTHSCFLPESINEQQPVHGGRGRYLIVFDGRLDNRESLAEQLRIPLAELPNLPDSTIAMRAWERWEGDVPQHLLGEFALIVWDAAQERLFAARDHFGFRTLSYHVSNDRIVIASTPSAVLAAGGIKRTVDRQKIADALADFHDDGALSFYRDISRIPPAHALTADRHSVAVRRYWSLEYRDRDIRYRTDQDYVDAGRELLAAAVKTRVRCYGLVGAELSGGLDSSAVAVTALGLLAEQENLSVFTNVPDPSWSGDVGPDRYPDETPFVRSMVAMHPRLDPTFLPGDGLGWDHALDDNFNASEVVSWAPMGNMAMDQTFRAAGDRGVKVMLCGQAGNATLSWGGHTAYANWFKRLKFGRLFRELRASSNDPAMFLRSFLGRAVLPAGPDWLWHLYKRWKDGATDGPPWSRYSFVNPDFARTMQVEARAERFGFNFYGRPTRDSRDARAHALTSGLTNENGEHNQGMRGLYGIEYRDPLHDRRLVEWCLRIPDDQYLRNGQTRWLMRRILQGLVPEEVRLNKRRGAILPDWHVRMSRDLPAIREQFEVLASDPDISEMLDIPRIRQVLDDWPSQMPTGSNDQLTWMLPRCLPHALATARFVRRLKGANL